MIIIFLTLCRAFRQFIGLSIILCHVHLVTLLIYCIYYFISYSPKLFTDRLFRNHCQTIRRAKAEVYCNGRPPIQQLIMYIALWHTKLATMHHTIGHCRLIMSHLLIYIKCKIDMKHFHTKRNCSASYSIDIV